MKRKGFTLIEIIGVIIIIGLLVIIAVPFFTRSLNTFRDDYYVNLVNTVKISGQEFFSDNERLLPLNSLETQKVLISTLESEKYLNNVLDYNNDECDDTSFIRVINLGKEGYKYVTCLKCSKDNYETISENDECNAWWDSSTGITSAIGNPDVVYIYKGATREELEEKVILKADLIKTDASGTIVGRVKGEGMDSLYLMPVNLDSVDLNKEGEYELKYVNGNVTLTGKVVVYENSVPGVRMEKVEAGSSSDNGVEIDLTPGKEDWAQKLIIKIDEGVNTKYSETGIKIAMYQWNRGGRWKDFCEPVLSNQGCMVKIAEEVNKEIVKFRVIDEDGNIGLETEEFELRVENTKPKCELKAEGEQNSSGVFITPPVISFETNIDQGTIQGGIKQYGIGDFTGPKTITHDEDTLTGATYTGYIADYANNTSTCSITVKQKKTYLLTYNNNSGSGCTNKNIIYSKPYGDLCTPSRTGYTFAGWFTAASGGSQVTKDTVLNKDEDRTVYAHWTPNKYTLDINPDYNKYGANYNGGAKVKSFDLKIVSENGTVLYNQANLQDYCSATGEYNATYYITNVKYRDGYHYASNALRNDSAQQGSNLSLITQNSTTFTFKHQVAGTMWFSINTAANTYTIAFNGNGATGGSTGSRTCTYDQNCVLTGNGFSRTNYNFQGWATSSGGGVAYGNGATVKNLATSGTVTLYANWKLALVNKCRYRTRSRQCWEDCDCGCDYITVNGWCHSYCCGESCEWTGWSSWSEYSTAYTSYTNTDSREVECGMMAP